MMKPIIPPVDKELLLSELSQLEKIRDTHHGGNEIYVFSAQSSPNLMREVGRLREEAFRDGGGGTGMEIDIDEDDTAEDGYNQLIAWNPKAQEIVGGYRYIISHQQHPQHLSTEHYFKFSEQFREGYLPHTIELGRAFVRLKYQPTAEARFIYALDNLWDGIGALIALHPEAKYLLGKVTMYSSYNEEARNMLFYFLNRYFPDKQHLVEGLHPMHMDIDTEKYDKLFVGESYAENYGILRHSIREYNEMIPPLVNAYMNLSSSMKVFDTVPNKELGDVFETGILITIEDIYQDKYDRYTKW